MKNINKKPVVLFVDDDVALSEIFTQVLQDEGYLVIPAISANRMWGALHSIIPDIILLDYYIGSQNGVKLAKEIREESGCENIPIIFLTSVDEKPEELKKIANCRFMGKPFELNALLLEIRKTIK